MRLGIEQLPILDTIKGMVWGCKGGGFENSRKKEIGERTE